MNSKEFLKHLLKESNEERALENVINEVVSYNSLLKKIEENSNLFKFANISEHDTIAIVLANGPNMAAVFLSVLSSAIAAPLNPSYTESEFMFYMKDLEVSAIVIDKNDQGPARKTAKKLGLKIINSISKDKSILDDLRLDEDSRKVGKTNSAKDPTTALILHTSGTTSKPKMVPLNYINLISSAKNITKSLNISNKDKCINIMPLFHIHGLIACLLAPLYSGGCVITCPQFNALSFYKWLNMTKPTWYSAVPTMHQTILSRANKNFNFIKSSNLKFIRSSSAPLPNKTIIELREIFNIPVIESYGMTEATHQITSNPLKKGKQKIGSVGIPSGPEVKILDSNSKIISNDATGEIIIKGKNVTRGYIANKETNQKAFYKDWFRTGDQGYIDSDGYLIITGRIKEIINRGGEKISPIEVDNVLLEHPSVAQAVTFSIPHDKLGEDIAAALVPNEEFNINEKEIKKHCLEQLAKFKVPNIIKIVKSIPKGPTGKLQRNKMAKLLGLEK